MNIRGDGESPLRPLLGELVGIFTPETSKLRPFKMAKVLLRYAVLLLGLLTLLAIFIIAAVSRNNDLLSHSDHEISPIGGRRPSLDFHRTKRDFRDLFSESQTDSTCPVGEWPCSNGVCIDQEFRCDKHLDCLDGSDEANCLKPDEPQTRQDNKRLPLIAENDTGGQQKDLGENVPMVPTSSQKPKTRVSGEDPNAGDDLGFDPDVETPLIERHRQSSIFHRIKRAFWDMFPEFIVPDEPQTEQDEELLPFTVEDDTGGQQKDSGENVSVVPTSSQEPKTRHINDVKHRIESDDEDDYGSDLGSGSGSGSGSDEIEGSVDKDIKFDSHLKPHLDIDVKKPVTLPGLESRPGPDAPTHSYRVTIIIDEPYRQSLADRNSDQFAELSGRLSRAIDGLYQSALPDQRTSSKILQFVKTSDPVAIWVFLEIKSTSPDVEKNRSIFAEQLQLRSLGNIRARPDGFSLKNVQDLESEECKFEMEFRCRSDGECITITAKCDGIIQCIDGSDEADCSPLETTTIVEVPEATTDPIESSSEAVEKKLDRIDDLIERVQRMEDALEELTATNKLLTQEIVKLQIANAMRN